ncbi:MAG TPA: zinc-ribbon domain-containing transport protein [Candidatus Eremiobacteraceae bacterium]|nr:zinc-ribbon domain-containing transport protein [Candidatus Eremiobacteraceae bacterium]
MGLLNFLAWLVSGNASETVRAWTSDSIDVPPDAFGAATDAATPSAPSTPMWQQAKAQIASLSTIDPDFSEVAFLEQATKTYLAALQAENDMNPSELGDRATAHFTDQLAQCVTQWQSAGIVRHVSGVKLDSPMTFKVSVDGLQQLITVRFTGQATRYSQDEANRVVTDGSTQPALFTEFAVFVRPAGTTTPKAVGAGAPSHCPSCGAPVDPGVAVCPYCNTPLTGTGSYWQIDRLSASPYT